MLIQEQIIQLHQQIDSLTEQIRFLAHQEQKPVHEQPQAGIEQDHLQKTNSTENLSSHRNQTF